ncbi:MAG: cytochrome c oxidase subunit II [Candidatus Carbobacillus altaicus]|uniref:Cytochrome aa3 subunit 2 n=1 Tax=Candidatus Carbonibacillus altaicus TaxID=2163959 RepID=A0A2R6Y4G0_9BACL|nr:cytochrome c oxidase subunit II [Candidatus Carbobacillus altaicus]PTQ57576.1 MAG: Cytochrome c oxidase (B(O/a)3-type) chain II [Candidatus Carbobacillus altaicus]
MHLHRYEKIWLSFGITSLIVFLAVLAFTAFAEGHTPPGGILTVSPESVDQVPPFNAPGVYDRGDYVDVYIVGQIFSYNPNRIELPLGKPVHFYVTTKDVVHSFTIIDTTVNMMLIPGYVNSATYTFEKPGSYLVLCNEYCGAGHQLMQMEVEVKG